MNRISSGDKSITLKIFVKGLNAKEIEKVRVVVKDYQDKTIDDYEELRKQLREILRAEDKQEDEDIEIEEE